MAVVDPQLNDHMTRVKLRLLKQKLDQERQRYSSYSDAEFSSRLELKRDLDVANSKRNKLLQRLKYEEGDGELRRANSLPHRRLDRRRIWQEREFRRRPHYQQSEDDYGNDDLRLPALLPATASYQYYNAQPVSYPSSTSMAPVQFPAATTTSTTAESKPYNRTDMYDLMMIQNAQMHQMIMQQMMLSALPRQQNSHSSADDNTVLVKVKDLIQLKQLADESPVPYRPTHSHVDYYQQQQPAVSYPYVLPPIHIIPPVITAPETAGPERNDRPRQNNDRSRAVQFH